MDANPLGSKYVEYLLGCKRKQCEEEKIASLSTPNTIQEREASSCVLPRDKLVSLLEESKCSHCRQHSVKVKDSKSKGYGCTPSFYLHCSSCGASYQYHTSATWENPSTLKHERGTLRVVPVLFLVGILLSGLTYHQVSQVLLMSD